MQPSEKIITDHQHAVLNYLQELIDEKLTELQIISAIKTDQADTLTINFEKTIIVVLPQMQFQTVMG